MGFDALLKRYFPAVVCFLLAMAAYFQASGMTQLVAASVAGDGTAPKTTKGSPATGAADRGVPRSAQPILARNPFDSITGPLDGQSYDIDDAAPVARNTNDPYQDPLCDAASVTAIIATPDDPGWSFASVQTNDGTSQLRRIGDEVNSHKVTHIGWYPDAPDPRPRVWLGQGNSRCQLDLNAEKKGKAKPKASKTAARGKKTTAGRRSSKVPPEIAAKIHKISDTEYELDRSVVDEILEQQALLMKSVRMRPSKDGGMKLHGIRKDSLLGTLGLKNGDQLLSINGFDMSDPEKALEAYTRLRTADQMTVQVTRKGKPASLDYKIK